MAITVEKCLELDIGTASELIEKGGPRGEFYWSKGDDRIATVGYHYGSDELRLVYTVSSRHQDENRDLDYTIPLEHTPANFGGERTWFNCPQCHSRRAKLHKPPTFDRFLCRDCHDLIYESQTYKSDLVTALDQWSDASDLVKEKGISRETLRQVYNARKDVHETFNARVDAFSREFGDQIHRSRFDELPPFEVWAEHLLEDALGRPWGEYGRCEADAKSTGERCRQPATGEHGKCYYHGGAEGSGAPGENTNAVNHGAYSGAFLTTLNDQEWAAIEAAAGHLQNAETKEDLARYISALGLLRYRRSGDDQFLGRIKRRCAKFGISAEQREAARDHVEDVFRTHLGAAP